MRGALLAISLTGFGLGIPLIAQPGGGPWQTAGWLAVAVGALAAFGALLARSPSSDEGARVEGDLVVSHRQSGGITAHTVNVHHEPPELETELRGDRVLRDGKFVTTLAANLSGYPKRLGLSAESAGVVEEIAFFREGSDDPLTDTRRRETEGKGQVFSFGNPRPGRYIAEVFTPSDMDRLHIEWWLE